MSKVLRRPIELYKGENRSIGIKWERNGVPVDISSITFRADIKDAVGGNTLFTLTSAGGGFTIVDGPNGEYQMNISKVDLDNVSVPTDTNMTFPFARVVFDIEADDGGSPQKVFLGTFQVYEEITTSG